MLVPMRISTNMVDRNQQKYLLLIEFCYKSVNLFFEKLINIKILLFLVHELFR